MFLRAGTFDATIRATVLQDYPATPHRFSADDVVLDVGCHVGTYCLIAADRGATVVGYEANRENHALACINVAGSSRINVRNFAVWRSDRSPAQLTFTPSSDGSNTGEGSVLFRSAEEHRRHCRGRSEALPGDRGSTRQEAVLTSHPVRAVGLDAVLEELGDVRLMKIDVEGAEFPILFTATRR